MLARQVLLIARKYVQTPTPPIDNGIEMGRRRAEADAFHGIRLPSPNPPSALFVYIHDAVPALIVISPSVSWALPFQLVLGVKTACTPFCTGLRFLLTPVDKYDQSTVDPSLVRTVSARDPSSNSFVSRLYSSEALFLGL